tara:strand:+ start:93 stop:527 length:435 start_codon:yes stop_codon:yes gene_type:complete
MAQRWADLKPLGAAAEMLVAHELMSMGLGISMPLGDSEPYDLIATHKRKLSRLQVKSTHAGKDGVFRVLFRRGSSSNIEYCIDDCDYMVCVIYYVTGPSFYVIPVGALKGARGIFWEQGKHPRHPDKWVRCIYEDYRNAWSPLF